MLQGKEEDIGEIYQDTDNQAAILIRPSDVDDGIIVVSTATFYFQIGLMKISHFLLLDISLHNCEFFCYMRQIYTTYTV